MLFIALKGLWCSDVWVLFQYNDCFFKHSNSHYKDCKTIFSLHWDSYAGNTPLHWIGPLMMHVYNVFVSEQTRHWSRWLLVECKSFALCQPLCSNLMCQPFAEQLCIIQSLIARFMRQIWGPSEADRTQVGPMLALWTLLSGMFTGEECNI